jgi:hypothetical protein
MTIFSAKHLKKEAGTPLFLLDVLTVAYPGRLL